MSQRDNGFTYKDGVSLRDYFESKIEALDKAISVAKEGMEYRLESMNEFRSDMQRMEGSFVTRKELDTMLENIKDDKRAVYALIMSMLAILTGIVGVFIK